MPQEALIEQLSKLDDGALSHWCHHALLEDYIKPFPIQPRESGIAYLREIHDEAPPLFQQHLRQILFGLLLDYIEAIRIQHKQIALNSESVYLLATLFGKIKAFKYHKVPVGTLLFRERKLLLDTKHGTISLYGLLFNLYVLWSDGSDGELLKNEEGESYALMTYLHTIIDDWDTKQYQDLDILIVGLKYFATRRLIIEFFDYYEKFGLLSSIEHTRKVTNLENTCLYFYNTKNNQGIEMLNSAFHGFIDWYLNSKFSTELLTELALALKQRLAVYNTESDAFYALMVLLGDETAESHFVSVEGGLHFVSPTHKEPCILPTSLYGVIYRKINKIAWGENVTAEGQYDPILDDLEKAAAGASVDKFFS